MALKITDKDLAEWRTGLHAANPEQCKLLVAMLDREKKISEAFKDALNAETIEINSAIEELGLSIPNGKISSRVILAFTHLQARKADE